MSIITIAESEERPSAELRKALESAGHQVSTARSIEEALRGGGDSDVLVVGPSLVGDSAVDVAKNSRMTGGPAIVFVTRTVDADLMRRAMRAGVGDVIPMSSASEEIAEAVAVALASTGARTDVQQAPGAAKASAEGHVITIFSTKGGVGKTVVATNLGIALSKAGKRVVLVDLDLQFGDVGIMLGLEPEYTIYEVVQAYERLDPGMLQGFLVRHESGLRVMLAPVHPEDAEAVTATRIKGIISLLRQTADYVVVDTSSAFNDATLAALDESDVVYVVTMMDVASIKNTRISVQKLKQLGYHRGVLRFVLNRADSKVFLNVGDVEEAVGGRIISRIPSDLGVPRSVNRGVPIVIDSPRSKVARSLLDLAVDAVNCAEGGEVDVA
jgi:pilus assembly protein CpaE